MCKNFPAQTSHNGQNVGQKRHKFWGVCAGIFPKCAKTFCTVQKLRVQTKTHAEKPNVGGFMVALCRSFRQMLSASILAWIATRSIHSRNRHVFCVALRSMHSGLLFVLAVVGVPVVVLRWLLPRFRSPLLPLLSAAVFSLSSQRSPRTLGVRLRGGELSLGSSLRYTLVFSSGLLGVFSWIVRAVPAVLGFSPRSILLLLFCAIICWPPLAFCVGFNF